MKLRKGKNKGASHFCRLTVLGWLKPLSVVTLRDSLTKMGCSQKQLEQTLKDKNFYHLLNKIIEKHYFQNKNNIKKPVK